MRSIVQTPLRHIVPSWTISASYLSLSKTGGRTNAFSCETIFLGRSDVDRRVVISLGPQGFNVGSTLVSGGPKISTIGIFIFTKQETAQMKAASTRPTAPKKFLFSIKRLCAQQATSFLAAIVGVELTHNSQH
jgi:hypothetical protein